MCAASAHAQTDYLQTEREAGTGGRSYKKDWKSYRDTGQINGESFVQKPQVYRVVCYEKMRFIF